MSITNKTRKLLWGRSGNLCAICKEAMVIEKSDMDSEAIVGDECHIVSSKENGPRFKKNFPNELIDDYENLILLCRVHHKMIDDQSETYTQDILLRMKKTHETWVRERLSKRKSNEFGVKTIAENQPSHLPMINTGQELFNIVAGMHSADFSHDQLENEGEVEIVANFLQVIQDWGELADEFEAGKRVEVTFELDRLLKDLNKNGFLAFGYREIKEFETSKGLREAWPHAIIRVIRKDSSTIIKRKAS